MAIKKKAKKATTAKAEAVNPKDRLKAANEKLTKFLKENKLARDDDHSKNKKFGTEYKELVLEVEKATEALEGKAEKAGKSEKEKPAKKAAKESKGDKSAGRATVYEYPDGLTPAEKKEFRVKARKAAKAAEKGTSTKAEKSTKAKKEDAPKAKGGKKEVAEVKTKDIKKKKKKAKGSKND